MFIMLSTFLKKRIFSKGIPTEHTIKEKICLT